jgi:hypothetical protein
LIRKLENRDYFWFKKSDLQDLSDDDIIDIIFENRYHVVAPVALFRDRLNKSKSWNKKGVHSQTRGSFPKWVIESGYCVINDSQTVSTPRASITRKYYKTSVKTKWPLWEVPNNDILHETMKTIVPFIRFLDPRIVEKVAKQDIGKLINRMQESGIDTSLYYWEKAPVAFPGVRRYVGRKEKRGCVLLAKVKEEQAIYIDDNSYPKHIWAYVFTNSKFANLGPNNYELMHLFSHKKDANTKQKMELSSEDSEDIGVISGFFTSIAGTAYIPRNFVKITDFCLKARKLLHLKAWELYSSVCNILPPGIILEKEEDDWSLSDFPNWANTVGDVENVDAFLKFRIQELEKLTLFK